jgi:hypothetical protein
MDTLLTFLIVIFGLGMIYMVLPFTFYIYRRFNYRKVVSCPETGRLTEIKLNALRAALTAIFRKPSLRVKSCTLWPKKKGCAERCVKENWPAD